MILDTFVLSQSLSVPSFSLNLEKICTSKKSAIVNAKRLAIDILIEVANIVSYAISVPAKRVDGGSNVKNVEVITINTMIIIETLMISLILSLPKTSTMISLIEKITGKRNIATLALN